MALPVIVPALGAVTVIRNLETAEPQELVMLYFIVSVPADTPVTILPLTVAMLVLVLLQVPPVVASFKVSIAPLHTDVLPVIVPAEGELTVIAAFATPVPQELLSVYFMVSIPEDTPVTVPALLIVAIDALPLLHIPPDDASFKVSVEPTHTVALPVIVPAYGAVFTITVKELVPLPQELLTVYFITELPAFTPVTTPAVLIVA